MDFEIIWTENAAANLNKIINYLEKNWTDKEISKFLFKLKEFTELLCLFPKILKQTKKYDNIFRGPINKYTIITYRINTNKKRIEIISLQASKEYILVE